MKKYHINFKIDADSFFSTGENFEAPSPIIALAMFSGKHPNATFLAMYCVENISKLASHRIAFEEDNLITP